MGSLELAIAEVAAGRDPRADIVSAQEAAGQAAQVGLQMLSYLGLGSRGRQTLDLVALCSGAALDMERTLRPQVRLRTVLPDRAMTMSASSADIRQMLMNLVANAEEAIALDGEVVIAVREVPAEEIVGSPLVHFALTPGPSTYACLEVSDSGKGMGAEVLKNAFDPFFTTKFTGRGLGLPVVQGVVRAHDGTLELNSTPGVGTTVRVYFPLLQVQEEPS
jgi:signal transduction histidine kinase